MKILIFVSHPAQYLFYRPTILFLTGKKHQIKLLIKTKDVLEKLVLQDGLPYENILSEGRSGSNLSILFALIKRDIRLYKIVRKFKPELLLGTDASIAHVSYFTRIPSIICLEDDYPVIRKLAKLTYPFARHIFAPGICDVGKYAHKKISYDGYMKLAYLHPDYFKLDRDLVRNRIGDKKYVLVRLSALEAYHDKGIGGIDPELLQEILKSIGSKYRIYIISEKDPGINLETYHLDIHPSQLHHYLGCAEFLLSDSQSMSVEASILGVPSIRISDFSGKISVLEELEHRYQLTFGAHPHERERIFELIDRLQIESSEKIWQERRNQLLEDKVNVSKLLSWLISEYPDSANTLKEDPSYSRRFS